MSFPLSSSPLNSWIISARRQRLNWESIWVKQFEPELIILTRNIPTLHILVKMCTYFKIAQFILKCFRVQQWPLLHFQATTGVKLVHLNLSLTCPWLAIGFSLWSNLQSVTFSFFVQLMVFPSLNPLKARKLKIACMLHTFNLFQ